MVTWGILPVTPAAALKRLRPTSQSNAETPSEARGHTLEPHNMLAKDYASRSPVYQNSHDEIQLERGDVFSQGTIEEFDLVECQKRI